MNSIFFIPNMYMYFVFQNLKIRKTSEVFSSERVWKMDFFVWKMNPKCLSFDAQNSLFEERQMMAFKLSPSNGRAEMPFQILRFSFF